MAAYFGLSEDENETCTLIIMSGFGGQYPNGIFEEATRGVGNHNPCTLAEFKQQCRSEVENWEYSYSVEDLAAIQATTSSLQIDAERNLKELGFIQNGPFESKKYNGISKLSVWVMSVADFLEAIKE